MLIFGADMQDAPTKVNPMYHQIAKTGITSILTLMVAGLGNATIRDDPFNHAYQGAHYKRPTDFYIGTIRNPCNYYVSLWSYNVQTNNSAVRKDLEAEGHHEFFANVTANKSSAHDIQVFQSFTKHISGDIGVFTGRLAYGYIPYSPLTSNFSTRGYNSTRNSKIKSMFDEFNTSRVDCWVDTNSVTEDATICLQMLEKDYNLKVYWDAFDTAKGNHNPSKHAPCKDYYDKEMERFVREKDGVVFKKFGYDQCCDAASALAAHRTYNPGPIRQADQHVQ